MSDGAEERLWPGPSDEPGGTPSDAGADTDELDGRVADLFSSAIDRQVAEQRQMNRLLADLDRSFSTIRSRLDELQGQVARDVAPAADRLQALERTLRTGREETEQRIDALGERLERQIRSLAEVPPPEDGVGPALDRLHERIGDLERRLDESAGAQRDRLDQVGAELGERTGAELRSLRDAVRALEERPVPTEELRQLVRGATEELRQLVRGATEEQRAAIDESIAVQRGELADALVEQAARLRDVMSEEAASTRAHAAEVVGAGVSEALASRAEHERSELRSAVFQAVAEAVAEAVGAMTAEHADEQRSALGALRASVEQALGEIDLPGWTDTRERLAGLAAVLASQQAALDSRLDDLQAGLTAHRSAVAGRLEEHRDAVWQHIQVESAAVDTVARELSGLREDVRGLAEAVAATEERDEQLRGVLADGLEPISAQLARLTTRPALSGEDVRRAVGEALEPVVGRLSELAAREPMAVEDVAAVVADALAPVTEQLVSLGAREGLSVEDVRSELERSLAPLVDGLRELASREGLSVDDVRAVVAETVAPIVPEVTGIVASTASGLGAEVTDELRPIVSAVLDDALQQIRATLDRLGEASTAALERHAAAVDRAARHADQVEAGVQRVHADLEELGAASDLLGRRIEELGSAVVAHGAAVVEIRDAIAEVRETVEIDSARTDRSTRSAQEVTQRLLTRVDDLERGLVTYVEAWGDRLIQERRDLLGNLVGQLAEGLTRRERKRLLGTLQVPSAATSPPRLERPTPGPDEMPPPRRVVPPRVAQAPTWPTIPDPGLDDEPDEDLGDRDPGDPDHGGQEAADRGPSDAGSATPDGAPGDPEGARVAEDPVESGASAARKMREALGPVPGVGPAKQSALVDAFGTLEELRAASDEELAAVPGIGPGLAERIRATLG